MLPNLSNLTFGGDADVDQRRQDFIDLLDNAARAAKKASVNRRRPPLPPRVRPPSPLSPLSPLPTQPTQPLSDDDYDGSFDSDSDPDDGYDSDDYRDDLAGNFELPSVPMDIDVDPEVLDSTVGNLTKLLNGGVTRKETIELLVEIRSNAAELWEALVDCYRENAKMAKRERERAASAAPEDDNDDTTAPPTPKKSTTKKGIPLSLQKIMMLLTALMALISFKGPELITSIEEEPMEGNGGVYMRQEQQQPGVRMLPARPALPALPPPGQVVVPQIVRREGGRAGTKPSLRGKLPYRPPAVPPTVPPTVTPAAPPPLPATPAPSSAPLAPVDSEWWSEYLKRSLLAMGIGVLGAATRKR